jgi:hypothetical protein
MGKRKANVQKASERFEQRIRNARNKNGLVTVSLVMKKQDGFMELVDFNDGGDVPDIIERVSVLCTAVAQAMMTTKPEAIAWPLWVHYVNSLASNTLGRSITSALKHFGVEPKEVEAFMRLNADRMNELTRDAILENHKKGEPRGKN